MFQSVPPYVDTRFFDNPPILNLRSHSALPGHYWMHPRVSDAPHPLLIRGRIEGSLPGQRVRAYRRVL